MQEIQICLSADKNRCPHNMSDYNAIGPVPPVAGTILTVL